jgi:hypothetical protein
MYWYEALCMVFLRSSAALLRLNAEGSGTAESNNNEQGDG